MQKESALVETDLNADNITVPNDLFNFETSHEGLAIENIEQCKLFSCSEGSLHLTCS